MADQMNTDSGPRAAERAGRVVTMAGAATSLALIVGVSVWGYNLLMRDVTGIPVVRAMEGPMRTAAENPGGDVALHDGLSVNAVAAMGEAEPPEDSVVLAPPTVDLSEEDLQAQTTAEDGEVAISQFPAFATDVTDTEVAASLEPGPDAAPVTPPVVAEVPDVPVVAAAPDPDKPLTADDILALADRLAAGAAPLDPLAEGATTPEVAMAVNGVSVADIADIVPSSTPGVSQSPRPPARPETLVVVPSAPAAVPADTVMASAATTEPVAPAAPVPVEPGSIPAGTNLVQLGAYDSPEVAAAEWSRISTRFPDYLAEKSQVIQQASSGGKTFFRLRAMGFVDLADARRFCAALIAEDAACIPVVVR